MANRVLPAEMKAICVICGSNAGRDPRYALRRP